jgi:hypothetical protein
MKAELRMSDIAQHLTLEVKLQGVRVWRWLIRLATRIIGCNLELDASTTKH